MEGALLVLHIFEGLECKTHAPLPRGASPPSYTRETRVLVASLLSPLAAQLRALSFSLRRRGGELRIESDPSLAEELAMGGEKDTFDLTDLNASLPAAAAGDLRSADTVSHPLILELPPNRSV